MNYTFENNELGTLNEEAIKSVALFWGKLSEGKC